MKTKKITAFLLAVMMLTGIFSVGVFASYADLGEAKASFQDGVGPETNGYAIDYVYYYLLRKMTAQNIPL